MRVAALVYLLAQAQHARACAQARNRALALNLVAADPHASPLVRATCARIARQWREMPAGYRH